MRWALLAAVLASLTPAMAEACSCAPLPMILQSELTDSRAIIFIGTVEGNEDDRPASGSFFSPMERLLRVRPFFFLRGSWPQRPVELWAGSVEGAGDCGAHLQEGWTYLLVASRSDDGKLAAGQCSLTTPLFAFALLIGFLGALWLLAGAVLWGLRRLLRRFRSEPSSSGAAQDGRQAALGWLVAAGAFLMATVLLWKLAPRLSPPVEVTVCNRMTADALEQIQVRWLPELSGSPPDQLGRLEPGACRTERLDSKGVASLQVTYQVQGSSFTVQDEALRYVEGGFRTSTEVKGPGTSETEVELDFFARRPWILALALGLLACLSAALAALCCAALVALSNWGRTGAEQQVDSHRRL